MTYDQRVEQVWNDSEEQPSVAFVMVGFDGEPMVVDAARLDRFIKAINEWNSSLKNGKDRATPAKR